MEESEEKLKAKNLAVFENVANEKIRSKKKFRPIRLSNDIDNGDGDNSDDSDDPALYIDETEENPKRKSVWEKIRFKKEPMNLTCQWKHCEQIFSSTDSFQQHLTLHIKEAQDTFQCEWENCPSPNDISTIYLLIQHISYHGYLTTLINVGENELKRNRLPDCKMERKYQINLNTDGHKCCWSNCDCVFSTAYDFFLHVECHSNGAPSGKKINSDEIINCDWANCTSTFSTRYKLMDHLRAHTLEKKIACPTCYTMFSTRTTFRDHRNRQLTDNLKTYQCSQCLKLFSTERLLSDHMRAHINHYKCSLCDMTSISPSMLAKHYRHRHLKLRPFSCPQCEKTFVTKCNLNTHLKTHEVKPFQCELCSFGCKSKFGLNTHMVKEHGLDKPQYQCQLCKNIFDRGANLTRHLMNVHKFQWPSGHSRFKYRRGTDGMFRLETVRYESLEVTEEVIKSESMKSKKDPLLVTYNVTYNKESGDGGKFAVLGNNKVNIDDALTAKKLKNKEKESKEVIITIEDIDEDGNVINTKETVSKIILSTDDE